MEISYSEKFVKGISAFSNVAYLQNQIYQSNDQYIYISLSASERYGKSFIFLLGCLIVLGTQHKKNVVLYLPPQMMKHFRSMDILNYYRSKQIKSQTFFRLQTINDIISLVSGNVGNIPISMTEKGKELLVSLIGEVYNNAVDHSEANYIIGGCYFKPRNKKHKRRLCFSCYDTGIGIISSVKNYLKIDNDSWANSYDMNRKILKWALKKGNTTKPEISRGLGFDLLLNFAKLNNGSIRICDGDVLFVQDSKGNRSYHKLQNKFRGYFFEMEIVDDPNAKYCVKGE